MNSENPFKDISNIIKIHQNNSAQHKVEMTGTTLEQTEKSGQDVAEKLAKAFDAFDSIIVSYNSSISSLRVRIAKRDEKKVYFFQFLI